MNLYQLRDASLARYVGVFHVNQTQYKKNLASISLFYTKNKYGTGSTHWFNLI